MKLIKHRAPVFALRILLLLLCLAVGFTYLMGPQLAGKPSAPSIHLSLSFIAGLVIAIFTIASADKKNRKIHIVIWTILLSVWSVWITQIYITQAQEYEWFRWWGKSSSPLLLIHKALDIYHQDNSPLPSIKLLVAEQYVLPSIFLYKGSDTSFEDISIGSLSMQKFIDGDASSEQLWLAAKQIQKQGEWETVGDFVFSRRFDLYEKQDPNIIIGLCLVASRDGNYSVQYADGHSEVMALGSDCISAQNKLRKAQGLEPLPELP